MLEWVTLVGQTRHHLRSPNKVGEGVLGETEPASLGTDSYGCPSYGFQRAQDGWAKPEPHWTEHEENRRPTGGPPISD